MFAARAASQFRRNPIADLFARIATPTGVIYLVLLAVFTAMPRLVGLRVNS